MLGWNGTCQIPMVSPVCPTRYTVDSPMCTRDFDGELGHGSQSHQLGIGQTNNVSLKLIFD